MTNDMKPPPQNIVQPPEQTPVTTKVAAEVETGHDMVSSTRKFSRNYDVMHIVLRVVCIFASVVSIVVMVTAKEKSTISIYGFDLPLYSKWSFSGSFEYLVAASSVVAAHSLVQLVMTASRTLRKSSVFSSRNHAWLIFACDQCLRILDD
ncbi:CASP-like protein [Artemisia annua]|uniref:CASP-like protein n=1 Tax=Artemisia annua TaxID=35608 RepID=A0A2U1KS73_ARTAN|nr:CASP-like protein [Artemisia annua]